MSGTPTTTPAEPGSTGLGRLNPLNLFKGGRKSRRQSRRQRLEIFNQKIFGRRRQQSHKGGKSRREGRSRRNGRDGRSRREGRKQ